MRGLTMLAVMVAALMLASTGVVVAQKTTPDTNGTKQQGTTTTPESTTGKQQGSTSQPGNATTSGVTPAQSGTLNTTIYGPYSLDPPSGSGTYVGGGNHHFEYAYDVPPRPTGDYKIGGGGGDFARFLYDKYDPNTGMETLVGSVDNLNNPDNVHIDPDPYGNKYLSILAGELPPLKSLAGTGYYTVRVLQKDSSDLSKYKLSDPHYIYVY